jgi:hypothetical protein
MSQSKQWFYRCRAIFQVAVYVVLLILQSVVVLAQQPSYENKPVLSASKMLPPELLSGPNTRSKTE